MGDTSSVTHVKNTFASAGFAVQYLQPNLSTDANGDLLRVSKTFTWSSKAINGFNIAEIPYFQGIRGVVGGSFNGSTGTISFTITMGVDTRAGNPAFYIADTSTLVASGYGGGVSLSGHFGKESLLNLNVSGSVAASNIKGTLTITDKDGDAANDHKFHLTASNFSSAVSGKLEGTVTASVSASTNIPFLTNLKAVGSWSKNLADSTAAKPLSWTLEAGTTGASLKDQLTKDFLKAKNGLQLPDPIKNALDLKFDAINQSLDQLVDVKDKLGFSFSTVTNISQMPGIQISNITPTLLNDLFNGKKIDLIKFSTAGEFRYNGAAEYPWASTFVGPFKLDVSASIGGKLTGSYQVDIGLDTTGAWIGKDTNIELSGNVSAGVSGSATVLGLAGYKASLGVGVDAKLSLKLVDPDPLDGRLYFDELYNPAKDNLANLASNVLDAMRVDVKIDGVVYGKVESVLPWPFHGRTVAEEHRRLASVANSHQDAKLPISKRQYKLESVATPMPVAFDSSTGALVLQKTAASANVSLKQENATTLLVQWNGYADKRFTGVTKVTFNGSDQNDQLQVDPAINVPITAYGNAGDDTLYGGRASDILLGGTGNDTIIGSAGNDTLSGGDGDDLIRGGVGLDRLDGGNGNDSLLGDDNADTISGGLGDDYVDGGSAADILYGDVSSNASVGGNDTIYGGSGVDTISGGFGNDQAYGEDANDYIYGGLGNDTLDGGNGNDFLDGEGQNDIVRGGSGDDSLYGADGNDTLSGDSGNDEIHGGSDNDSLQGGGNNDTLYGEWGDDFILGGDGDDRVLGGDNNDTLNGEGGVDQVFGDGGDDTLQIDFFSDTGAAPDSFAGGSGKDMILVIGTDGDDRITLAQLSANVFLASGTLPRAGDTPLIGQVQFSDNGTMAENGDIEQIGIAGMAGNDILRADQTVGRNLVLLGGEGNDSLNGGLGADQLYGGAGNDTLFGGAGDDEINGEDGFDQLNGEAGSDRLYGGNDNDVLDGGADRDIQYGGPGDDTLSAGTGPFGDLVYGEDGNDVLLGGDGVDTLGGGDGNDTLRGGKLLDILQGGNGNDWLYGDDDIDFLFGEQGDDHLWATNATSDVSTINTGKPGDAYAQYQRLLQRESNLVAEGTEIQSRLDSLDPISDAVEYAFLTAQLVDLENELVVINFNQISLLNNQQVLVGTLDGGDGNDELHGSEKPDVVNGGAGNDVIYQSLGADTVFGGGDIDEYLIFGTPGNDDLELRADTDPSGNSIVSYLVNGQVVGSLKDIDIETATFDALDGDDTIKVNFGQKAVKFLHLIGGLGNDTLDASACQASTKLEGGDGNDWLYGGAENDKIYGGNGNDVLYGRGGNDELYGEVGGDELYGEDGNDYLDAGTGDDMLRGGAGWDRFFDGDFASKYPFISNDGSTAAAAQTALPSDLVLGEDDLARGTSLNQQTLNALAAIAQQKPTRLIEGFKRFSDSGSPLPSGEYKIRLYSKGTTEAVWTEVKFTGEWNDNDPVPRQVAGGGIRWWPIVFNRARIQEYSFKAGLKLDYQQELTETNRGNLDGLNGGRYNNAQYAFKDFLPNKSGTDESVDILKPSDRTGEQMDDTFNKKKNVFTLQTSGDAASRQITGARNVVSVWNSAITNVKQVANRWVVTLYDAQSRQSRDEFWDKIISLRNVVLVVTKTSDV